MLGYFVSVIGAVARGASLDQCHVVHEDVAPGAGKVCHSLFNVLQELKGRFPVE